jgi:uncharacterized membrane protein
MQAAYDEAGLWWLVPLLVGAGVAAIFWRYASDVFLLPRRRMIRILVLAHCLGAVLGVIGVATFYYRTVLAEEHEMCVFWRRILNVIPMLILVGSLPFGALLMERERRRSTESPAQPDDP